MSKKRAHGIRYNMFATSHSGIEKSVPWGLSILRIGYPEFKGAAHWTMQDQPEESNRVVREFLDSLQRH